MRPSRPPIRIAEAYEDPQAVLDLLSGNGPYWAVQRYLASESEAASVQRGRLTKFVIPWFRGDWAYGDERVDGVEAVLHNPRFIEAAKKLFNAPVVRPLVVYVNLMAPLPFAGEPHMDVPSFRGIDRTQYPVWFLHVMGRSGLFRDEQVDNATAVSWFYDGDGGAFDYWPDGPEKPPQSEGAPLSNVAIVGDNDFMFHRVGAIGSSERHPLPQGLSTDSLLVPRGSDTRGIEEWEVRDGDRCLASYPNEAIRISVSWKAEVFASEEALADRLSGRGDLGFDEALARLTGDLERRGLAFSMPDDPLRDSAFIDLLARTYPLPEILSPGPA